jgi:hypothetical protein
MGPYAGLIVDSEVKLSTPATTNVDECFPDYSNMGQPIGKERVRGRGMVESGADFLS